MSCFNQTACRVLLGIVIDDIVKDKGSLWRKHAYIISMYIYDERYERVYELSYALHA